MARVTKKTAKKTTPKKTVTYNGVSSYKKLSPKKLGIIIVVFSLLGIGSIIYASAATINKTTTVQAESLIYPQARVTSDKTSGVAELYWTATGTGSVTLPGATKKMVVTAYGSNCDGSPELQIKIDDRTVMRKTITATQSKTYELAVDLKKGDHSIAVSFNNDAYKNSSCDRNLFVDKIDFVSSVERKPTSPSNPTTPAPTPVPPTTTPKPTPTPTPTPTTPPATTPSSSVLKWTPPTLTTPTTISIPTGTAEYNAKLDASKDYVLKMPSTQRGPLVINGGRNVIVIGGSINVSATSGRGIYIVGNKGTVHVEGVVITANAKLEYDAIAINAPDSIVQLQNISAMNVRGSVNKNSGHGGWHGDIVQPWGGVKALRIDKFTGSTNYQGLFLRPDLGAIGSIDLSRISLNYDNVDPDGGGHLIWLTTGDSQTASSVVLDEIYLGSAFKNNSTSIGAAVYPQTNGAFPAVIGTDGSVTWPKLPAVSGKVKPGLPAGGAYVPAASVGTSYVSPGYR